MTMDTLTALGEQHGTDKANSHLYTPEYHRRFADLQNEPVRLLEIGVGGYDDPNEGGKSLRMWRDYFPNGTIVGLDIQPKALDLGERVHVEQGSATDNRVLHRLGKTYGPFDIIVDDGSHRCDDIVKAWSLLWDRYLTPDGWYVIEDLQTSYWPEYGGSSVRTGDTTIGWVMGLINHMHYTDLNIPNYLVSRYDETIVGVELARNIAFLRKGDNTKPSEVMPPHPHALVGQESAIEVTLG